MTEIRSHRAPRSRRTTVLAIVAALALVAGAISWSLTGATAQDSINPLDLAQAQGANCQVLKAHATSSAQRTRAQQCINDQGVISSVLAGTPSPSGTPSPTSTPTASPTPTTSPTASPTPTSSSPPPTANGCIPLPSVCGYPDATNTGATGTLITVNGDVTLSTAGQTYADKDVHGCILVTAPGVTIHNVKVACSGGYVIDYYQAGTDLLTIEDSTVICVNNPYGNAIGEKNLLVRRTEVTGCMHGFDLDQNATITDVWCHDLTDEKQYNDIPHTDCVMGQMYFDITIDHNTLTAPHFATSAIEGDCATCGSIVRTTWRVTNNLLDGGGYSVYCTNRSAESGSVIAGNRFGTNQWTTPPQYSTYCNDPDVTWSNNVRDATGEVLPAL